MRFLTKFAFIILFLSVTGCAGLLPEAHKVDIQQGNSLKVENISKLTNGMTEKQVVYLLGTPVIRDIFHPDRWDYVYTYAAASGASENKRLTLYFTGGKLSQIENVSFQEDIKPRETKK